MKFKSITNTMVPLVTFFLFMLTSSAMAESNFFGTYCASCHTNDSASCNACHAHGVWQDQRRTVKNLTATTDLDQYRPGQTVTVTFSGGYRQGWIRAKLYDHNGNEVDRVSGPTGQGDDGTRSPALEFPVILSAPAPSNPGFYTWSASWFGAPFDTNNSGTYPHVEESVQTNQFEVYVQSTCQDADGDGYQDIACNADPLNGGGDCDDTNPSVNPGMTEIPYNGVDDDCDPSTPNNDLDGDGYGVGRECNDNDPDIHPGAPEVCNDGIDNDCDGLIDAEDPDCGAPPPADDQDGDGYGSSVDCNDSDPLINPGAIEVCDDGVDNDCDGLVDSDDPDCTLPPPPPPRSGSLDARIKKLIAPPKVVVKDGQSVNRRIKVHVRANGARDETASGTLYLYKDGTLADSAPVELSGRGKNKNLKKHFIVTFTADDAPGCVWEAIVEVVGDPNPANNTDTDSTKIRVKYPKYDNDDDNDNDEDEDNDEDSVRVGRRLTIRR